MKSFNTLLIFIAFMLNTSFLFANEQQVEGVGDPSISEEAEQELQKFNIWEIRIIGNSLLEKRIIEELVYAHLGKEKDINDVENVRGELETAYRDAGYPTVLVSIPEQNVENGIIRLKVNEAEIERVKISGNKYFSRKVIREQLPSVKEGEPLYLPEVQKELGKVNRAAADRSVVPILRPGKTPGKVELELKVDDKLPLHAGLEWNGRNSPDTTRDRINSFVRYDNLWQKAHSVAINYQTTPEDRNEVEVYSATYVMPLFNTDNKLALFAVDSDSQVATLGDINVIGNGEIFGARAVFPFFGENNTFHSWTLGYDYKDFDQTVNLDSGTAVDTPISYSVFSIDFSGARPIGDSSSLNYGLGTRFGLRGRGNSPGEFERKRAGSRNNFMYWIGNLGYNHTFSNEGQFRSRLELQRAPDPLISNEQYSAGGQYNVRGYLTSQELADEAFFASLEYATKNYAPTSWNFLTNLKFVGFADYVRLHNRDTLPDEESSFDLSGVGLGLRLGAFDHFNTSVDVARALEDSRDGSDDVSEGDYRVHFSVEAQF